MDGNIADTPPCASPNKQKRKKWSKKSEKGTVNTPAALLQCQNFGVSVVPSLSWASTISTEHRSIRELQQLLQSVLQAMLPPPGRDGIGSSDNSGIPSYPMPTWLEVGNRAAIRQLHLITVTNAPPSMFSQGGKPPSWQPNSSGFFSQCGGSVPLRLSDRKSQPVELLDSLLIVRTAGGKSSGRHGGGSGGGGGGSCAGEKKKSKKRKRSDARSVEAQGGRAAGADEEAAPRVRMRTAEIYRVAQDYVLSLDKLRLLGYPLPEAPDMGDTFGSRRPTMVYSPGGYDRRPRSASDAVRAAGSAGLLFSDSKGVESERVDPHSDEDSFSSAYKGKGEISDTSTSGTSSSSSSSSSSNSSSNEMDGGAEIGNSDGRIGFMEAHASAHSDLRTYRSAESSENESHAAAATCPGGGGGGGGDDDSNDGTGEDSVGEHLSWCDAANAILDELAEAAPVKLTTDEEDDNDDEASSGIDGGSSASTVSPSAAHPSLLSLPSFEDAARVMEVLEAPRGLSTGFVQTLPSEFKHARQCATLVAIDCEMVSTTAGKLELARVSVVDERGRVLLDEFVKPYNEVTDYQTRYSGVTKEILDAVDTTLEQVQVALLGMLDASTVVVGHSLENDLVALKMAHTCCVDTAIIFTSHRGPSCKPALRHLTAEFLQRSIQASSAGHSSVEDARATLELALLKFRRGRAFGSSISVVEGGLVAAEGGGGGVDGGGAGSGLLEPIAHQLTCAAVGAQQKLRRVGAGLCALGSNVIIEERSECVLPHFTALQSDRAKVIVAVVDAAKVSKSSFRSSGGGRAVGIDTADFLQKQLDSLAPPPCTLTLLLLQGEQEVARSMARQRSACADPRSSSVWTAEQEKQLVKEVARSHEALAFLHLEASERT